MVDKKKIEEIFSSACDEGRQELTEYESKQVILAGEIPTTKISLAKNELEAVKKARNLTYPVVMKIVSPNILHKSDAGGVKIDLSSEMDVRQAFNEIIANAKNYRPDAEIWGVTVQKFYSQEREVIIGLFQDPTFGPTLMFGLGGIWVEVLEDVSFRLAPITKNEAREMIQEIKGYPILSGVRGEPPADVDALVKILQKVGQLSTEFEEISEMDLNPIFVYPEGEGAIAIDARIILKEIQEKGE